MPEARPSERRPIVPDPDSSLTRPRRPMAPQPRLWPLKFAVLLLLVMLVGVSWLGWQERERMNAQMQQISAEMSNVHARFDAEEGRGERFERFESRLSAVMDHAESLVARMASLEVDVQQVGERDGSRFAAIDERIDDLALRVDELSGNVERIVTEAEDREALLGAVRSSLNALERAGEEGREVLAARIDALAEDDQSVVQHIEELQSAQETLAEQQQGVRASLDERLEALDEHVQQLVEQQLAALEETFLAREAALEERLETLAGDIEAAADADDATQAVEELRARLAGIDTELRELRQEQLSLSAGLEALR